MKKSDIELEKPLPVIPMLRADLIGILLLGGAIGLFVWAFGFILNHFVFDVYFCQGEISSQCGSAKNYSALAAGLVGAIIALGGLIRLGVYRPLLVVIASMLSVWGVAQLGWGLQTLVGLLVTVVLYSAAFGLFGWVARLREFWIALVLIILLVIAVRLALTV